jgi:hypothetical protein
MRVKTGSILSCQALTLEVGRATMLHEQKLAARAQQAASFRQDPMRLCDAAQGPCGQDGVNAAALQRNVFATAFEDV